MEKQLELEHQIRETNQKELIRIWYEIRFQYITQLEKQEHLIDVIKSWKKREKLKSFIKEDRDFPTLDNSGFNAKLIEDYRKIKKQGHSERRLMFMTRTLFNDYIKYLERSNKSLKEFLKCNCINYMFKELEKRVSIK